ncbi:bifunctional sugar phosphate isomerase/epimerase/4-hydroxyphenylpyruvate dioxygenase family protein [Paracoccus siganidrum]|uniref:3-dehydroshikimate dehydratase n=1 Tax=Paracoccus siganidrum TaxID=1276757 RepID=A0A419A4U8_9RHOB|nr:sugar phosphate isomerase/epimerase and 4-hydroxyphenylpyruvate domain-containing protein [Paracoccus siganidrum]RJL09998.1 sugar phosphate isomerase/epimerase and 4-hydroxyphenylpyruvate domain-containing protein [Paracoccus siganidrum]RMC39612.1 3-keto-5-aminohexanoate cleavage protein [Paracoccus siganidrum]
MKTSIATVSISGSFREKLAAIAQAGFDGIEIFEQDFLASDHTPQEVGRMVRDHGLEITLFQPFRDFEGLPEPHRGRAFARAERKFQLMNELGTDLVLVCSTLHPQAMGGIDRAAADFRELGELAATYGIRVGYEALCWGRYVSDHRDAWEIVRRADHPNVGLILDSFHTLARKTDPDTIRSIPGDRIFFVQLADAPAIEMDLLYWSRHFRNMPGEGDLDVGAFTRAVLATGYAGPLSLEIFNDQFRSGLPRLVAQDGIRSLIALADQVRRDEPALTPDLPDFPAPAPVEDCEFVEFATSAEDAPALEALLASAGFEHAGRHRSKQVSLWRQNGVNLLVNAETEGFAHSAWLTHGTGVSEIALRVPDAQDSYDRAVALRALPHDPAHQPDELDIPGIRGVGGSVIRFVDGKSRLSRLWEVDFEVSNPDPAGAGLVRIDHLAQTMAYEEMLSWSLFYTTLFKADRTPMVDVVDPDGLVRSQAIRAGALRVTLNGAEARHTLAGRFIEETFGSAVQHIAFASDDIFATARAMAARGFPVLKIGANYFDDIEARFGLDPALMARLRAHDIMYDEDGAGRFFQFYSQPLAGGLFFEIVQRCDGYDGYGAPNAPFRIAAQKRSMRPAGLPRVKG